jgi:hypothetical protein
MDANAARGLLRHFDQRETIACNERACIGSTTLGCAFSPRPSRPSGLCRQINVTDLSFKLKALRLLMFAVIRCHGPT